MLINNLYPGTIPRIQPNGPFSTANTANIRTFLWAVEVLGLLTERQMFEIYDLYERHDLVKVIYCLSALHEADTQERIKRRKLRESARKERTKKRTRLNESEELEDPPTPPALNFEDEEQEEISRALGRKPNYTNILQQESDVLASPNDVCIQPSYVNR
jgi:hypothetical protein